jgi:Protein of unknown function (DUF3107)
MRPGTTERGTTGVEVKIGIRDVARDIVLESSQSPDSVATAVEQAVISGALLKLTDEKGRLIVVPGNLIGYVEIGAEESRRVGFGTL